MASPWIFCESLRLSTAPYYREARVTFACRQTACQMRHCCARRIVETGSRRKLGCTSTRWAERHPQGVCRIRKASEPPTAAQQRMIGAEANRIAASNAATPRAGSSIGKRCSSSSCSLAMQTPFFWTVTPPVFFPGKENGGVWCCGAHAAFPPPPETGGDISAPFGAEKGGTFDVFHRT